MTLPVLVLVDDVAYPIGEVGPDDQVPQTVPVEADPDPPTP